MCKHYLLSGVAISEFEFYAETRVYAHRNKRQEVFINKDWWRLTVTRRGRHLRQHVHTERRVEEV